MENDTYMAVVESRRMLAQIHLLWWNTSFWDICMNNVIMVIIM